MESERAREEECSILLVCCVVAAYAGDVAEDRHQCDVSGDGGVVLGESLDNDSRVYDLIVETFKKRKVATNGRAMLIVPHHPDLPRLFQTGKASDGDSTHRKPQYEQMIAVQGEDEIALQGSVDYHPQSDSLVGFCGPSPDGDASVYNRILDAFNTQKVATQGRVVMIVPHSE
jgi:hypothetical protein